MSKYHNEKVASVSGEVFDSKRELRRWMELQLLQRAGEITELERQVKYVLIPTQRIDGKVVEKECSYIADFRYKEKGAEVVQDAKGVKTKEYMIKRKLMLERYGIRIREV